MDYNKLRSSRHIYLHDTRSRIKLWFFICILVFFIFLFLPWTQNIRAKGVVTTLYQDQQPQQVNTIIGGRVMKWYIKEGDYVKTGDTLVQLSEVKVDYLIRTCCSAQKNNWPVNNCRLSIIRTR